MKYMAEKGKIVVKKWFFWGKKWVFGVEKMRVGNQSRKAKWYKTQAFFLKLNILKGAKD